ncbi:unnamed protein product [Urochloa decumbens]|uniref:Receptor-like serine/threonine-protein kinase n=1 Tax=Urochloa decumbens TaxID=240449 RepID=A0ABC9CU98_9POAL
MAAPARSLFLLFVVAAAVFLPGKCSASTDAIDQATCISGDETLVSAGGVFELGFFTTGDGADGRSAATYLGIWYYNITGIKTVVWVANRRSPVVNSPGVLRLRPDGRLAVLDGHQNAVWSSAAPTEGVSSAGFTARLLDSGNLVVSRGGTDGSAAWQSFDFPTDTLLPGMRLGVDATAGITRAITSWRSPDDPSPGDYTFKLVQGGLPQFCLVRGGATTVYTSGPWNGEILTGVPYLKSDEHFTFKVVWSAEETYYAYSIAEPSSSLLSRFIVDGALGQLQRLVWIDGSWTTFSCYPGDQCDAYAKCGAFGYCETTPTTTCRCLPGFRPRFPRQWSLRDGAGCCVRSTNLSCGGDTSADDGFLVVNRMKLPDATNATLYPGVTLEQCRQVCLRNCTCRAYAAASTRGGCIIWGVDLVDMRQYTTTVQDLYIRLAKSEIHALDAAAAGPASNSSGRTLPAVPPSPGPPPKKKIKLYIIVGASALTGVSILSIVFLLFYKRYYGTWQTAPRNEHQPGLECFGQSQPKRYSFSEVKRMTKGFAEKVGQGGFGAVYKGSLPDGQGIAVKMLKDSKGDGGEFKNEVASISRTAHVNVVTLLGFCLDGFHRALIYDFMSNGSLDRYSFGDISVPADKILSWHALYDILIGVARGLEYLDRGCNTRIVHLDIKPQNILLNQDLCPKIADFGLAKLCQQKDNQIYISGARGTIGYIAPEVLSGGQVSSKSDLFSFGMMILELAGARKNPEVGPDSTTKYFPQWLYENVDQFCSSNCEIRNVEIVQKIVTVGLWCIQRKPVDRPSISKVLEMLESTAELHLPPEVPF